MDTQTIKATIVISFRERWSLTLESIASIASNTEGPFHLWLLDTGMPDGLRQAVEARRVEWGLRIIDVSGDLWPNQARGRVASEIETSFAVFIDNDVLVMPGWLNELIDCAEETNAGIVGPLYLWGHEGSSDLIHMAGGDLTIIEEQGGRVMLEKHRHIMKRVAEVEDQLIRETCGFSEYHCMLMRREVFREQRIFDEDIVCAHEHIHASLVARELGYATWIEPKARVFYLAFVPWRLGELPLLRKRWSREAGEHSIQHFARRWNVIDDARSFGALRDFLQRHKARVDPLRTERGASANTGRIMERRDLEQTFAGLMLQAKENNYAREEVGALARAASLAMQLTDGMYRPCGRPFLNHLIGTASVMVFFGLELHIVLAGMLHAAFTHGPLNRSVENDALLRNRFACLGNLAEQVAELAWVYDRRGALYREIIQNGATLESLTMGAVNIFLIESANDIDTHLSLEVAASKRRDVPAGPLLDYMNSACEAIGLPGMAATLKACHGKQPDIPGVSFYGIQGSFYLTEEGVLSALRE